MPLPTEELQKRKKNTLIIDRWASYCGNCGKSTMPSDKTHKTIYGYGPENGSLGCGTTYLYVTSNYTDSKEACLRVRPDLEWLGDE